MNNKVVNKQIPLETIVKVANHGNLRMGIQL